MSPTSAMSTARVSFRDPVTTSGFVDGAWWPRSRDLAGELPGLLAAMAGVTREITRLTYMLAAWDETPRRVSVENHVVRLSGYTMGDPNTICLWDSWGRQRIDLLVIPPETDPGLADHLMSIAGRPDSLLRAGEIVAEANRLQSPTAAVPA